LRNKPVLKTLQRQDRQPMKRSEILNCLFSGRKIWNKFRLTTSDFVIDLRGIELEQDSDGSLDFSGYNLTKVDFSKSIINGIDMAGSNLQKAILRESQICNASFCKANLSECIFDSSIINSTTFYGATLNNSRLINANFCDCTFVDSKIKNIICADKSITAANYFKINFLNAKFHNTIFNNCNLSHSTASCAVLNYVKFINCNLSNVNLVNSKANLCHFTKCAMSHCNFSNCELRGIKIRNSDCESNNFTDSDCREAFISKSCLIHSKFNGTDLRSAEITRSDVEGLLTDEKTKYYDIKLNMLFHGQHFESNASINAIIEEFQSKHKIAHCLWKITSDCGRSFWRWTITMIVIWISFGILYCLIPINIGGGTRQTTFFTPFYFSMVILTTLGFGDVTPTNFIGEMLVAVEVILGYFMLGGALTFMTNYIFRRQKGE
jgi:uncharacterized protein YjbI with pentapeptide repeats